MAYIDKLKLGESTYELHDSRLGELVNPVRFIGITTITAVVNGATVTGSGLTT